MNGEEKKERMAALVQQVADEVMQEYADSDDPTELLEALFDRLREAGVTLYPAAMHDPSLIENEDGSATMTLTFTYGDE